MRVLVAGGTGFVGRAVVAALAARGHAVWAAGRSADDVPAARSLAADLREPGRAAALLDELAPDAVVNAAALADLASCAADPAAARRVNADAAGELAAACARDGRRLVQLSTDQVFDGSRGPWREQDAARPSHLYGETKLAGERAVLAAHPGALVLRAALATGRAPAGRRSASSGLLAALGAGETPAMFTDEWRTPIAVADLARAVAELVVAPDAAGVLHAGGPEALSRFELARREARAAGFDPGRLVATTRAARGMAERPADLRLDSARLVARLGWTPRALAEPGA